MKYLKRWGVLAVAVSALFVGMLPARATTKVTAVAVPQGSITVGSGLSHGAGLTFSGTCARGTVTGQPATGAGLCAVSTSGTAKGTCANWTGRVRGSIGDGIITVAAGNPRHTVDLTITLAGNAVTIVGTAVESNGTVRPVTGAGVVNTVAGNCIASPNGPTAHSFVGVLEIHG